MKTGFFWDRVLVLAILGYVVMLSENYILCRQTSEFDDSVLENIILNISSTNKQTALQENREKILIGYTYD